MVAGQPRTLENTDLVLDSHLFAPIANHKLTVGTEYKEYELIADDVAGIGKEFTQDIWSVYAEDEWSFIDDLTFHLWWTL